MCSIDKMLIKGIRSFSPDNTNVIEFYRPLTLIVGQNGAGKTVSCSHGFCSHACIEDVVVQLCAERWWVQPAQISTSNDALLLIAAKTDSELAACPEGVCT